MQKYIGTTCVVPIRETAMKRTLYIPDELWSQLEEYLKNHPEQNPSSLIQVALEEKLRPKNGSRLLELAGIVENAPPDASVNEDYLR
jgi:metal-responsive CopG/Arc/MetJ family transcriptional regulator